MPRFVALALALAFALAATGCIGRDEVVLRNELAESAWILVVIAREGESVSAFRANESVAAGGAARFGMDLQNGPHDVTASASTGASGAYRYSAGCGATCFLTVRLGVEGFAFDVLHGD